MSIAALVILLGSIFIAVWLARDAPDPGVKIMPRQTAAPPAATAPAELPQLAASTATQRRPGPGEVEVCGLGIFSTRTSNPDSLDATEPQQTAALESIYQRLAASADEKDRAAGLMMQMPVRMTDALPAAAFALSDACEDSTGNGGRPTDSLACKNAAQAYESAWQQQHARRTAPLVDALARLAAESKDPAVYAQAVSVCSNLPPELKPAACLSITLEQWARLEPQNSVPWLWLAEQAQARKDNASAAEALFRASQAKTVQSHAGLLTQQLTGRETGAVSELEQLVGLMQAITAFYSMALPPFGAVTRLCTEKAVADANRKQVCEDLASVLVSQSDSALGTLIGASIGSKLGWSEDRVATLRNETRALLQDLWVPPGPPGSDTTQMVPLDCGAIQHAYYRQRLIHERGELGAARELVRASGRSVEQVTQAYVQQQQQQQEKRKARGAMAAPVPPPAAHTTR